MCQSPVISDNYSGKAFSTLYSKIKQETENKNVDLDCVCVMQNVSRDTNSCRKSTNDNKRNLHFML